MNKVRLQKFRSSKLYQGPHELSIAYNNDQCHQKIWGQKVQQAKHVQQKRQIDKILHNIVKQRLFGNFLSQETRISTQGYYALDTINRQQVNPSRFKHSRGQAFNVKNRKGNSRDTNMIASREYSRTLEPIALRQMSRTLQVDSRSKPSVELSKRLPLKLQQSYNISNSIHSPNKKIISRIPKQLVLSKITDFSQFFRKMVGNNSMMIYDLRVAKQAILDRCQKVIDKQVMDKLFYFFSVPPLMGYRQYCNVVQSIINAPLKDIYFFIFRLLDSNRTGVLTISDFFRALQFYPDNTYVESQIYGLLNHMKDFNKQMRNSSNTNRRKKHSVQQVLVTNHSLRLEDVRELVKEDSHQLTSVNCIRNTIYHNSILSIQHDVNYRLKNQQIQDNRESSQANKKKGNDRTKPKNTITQEGLKLNDFIKFFNGKKPKMFCVFAQIFAGLNPQQYQ